MLRKQLVAFKNRLRLLLVGKYGTTPSLGRGLRVNAEPLPYLAGVGLGNAEPLPHLAGVGVLILKVLNPVPIILGFLANLEMLLSINDGDCCFSVRG